MYCGSLGEGRANHGLGPRDALIVRQTVNLPSYLSVMREGAGGAMLLSLLPTWLQREDAGPSTWVAWDLGIVETMR